MKKNRRILTILVMLAMCITMLAGCGTGGGENQMPQINSKVAELMEEDGSSDAEGTETKALQKENQIPSDGVISKAQMKSIAGKDMTVHFNGTTADGISYQWSYEGSQIQNPADQKLLIETSTKGLENIKKEASNASYALSVKLQKMQLAAAPTLTLTLKENWKVDKVFYCCEENGLKKLSDVKVSSADTKDGKVTVLSFTVSKADGTFYLIGGSSTTASDKEDPADTSENTDTKGSTVQNKNTDQNQTSEKQENQTQNNKSKKDTASSDQKSEEKQMTCTISIDCKEILKNSDKLRASKKEYVPKDGWILKKSTVAFEDGDTVFDILKRVTKAAGIHMESQWTPMYDSYYVEGIHQLYEFDCGEQSGWMYSVNGWFPNYGCSSYKVKDGDNIEWRYTCNLGSDVGGKYTGD